MSLSPVTQRRLWWQLLRVGWSAGKGTAGGRLRFAALVLAAMALTLAALSAAAAVAVYDGRDARVQARSPVPATGKHRPVALWMDTNESVGDTPHWVVYVEPLITGAAPPPGLRRWPAPGEALLSPELARAGADEAIKSRYGRYAGTIDDAGLASPAERLAYIRPATPPEGKQRERWMRVAGFGNPYGGLGGEALTAKPLSMVLLAVGALMLVPALALAVIAARVGSQPRDRRSSLLHALGGSWRHRALVATGEALVPVTVGAVLGATPLLAAFTAKIRLPFTDYILAPADMRAVWPLMAGVLIAVPVAAVVVVVLLHRIPQPDRQVRPRSFTERVPRWRQFGCLAAAALVVASPYVRGRIGLVMFVAGTVGLWASVPSVGGAVSRRLGNACAAIGRRRGNPGLLVGGRWTATHPGVVVRLATAMVIGLGLLAHLQLWTSRAGDMAREASATNKRIGTSVLVVQASSLTFDQIRDFTGRLPADSKVVTIRRVGNDKPAILLSGTCATLHALQAGCTSTPTAVTADSASATDPRVKEIAARYGELQFVSSRPDTGPDSQRRWRNPAEVLVVSDQRSVTHKNQIKQAASATLDTPAVGTLGEEWLLGVNDDVRLGHWLRLFGTAGLGFLLIAALIGIAAEFSRFGSSMAPLAAITGRRSLFGAVAIWHLTVPMIISVLISAVVTAWNCTVFLSTQDGHLSWALLGAGTAGASVFALATGVLAGTAAARSSRHWRPTAD